MKSIAHIQWSCIRELEKEEEDDDDDDDDDDDGTERRNARFLQSEISLRRELSSICTLKWPGSNRVQIACNTSSDYVQHVVLRATWYKGTVQLLSLTEYKSHLF